MNYYDISRPLLSAPVYPGDPNPSVTRLCRMEAGDAYNLSAFSACCHNGTHLDAPLHYCPDGASVAELNLRQCMGICRVEEVTGEITVQHVRSLLPFSVSAILWKGEGTARFSIEAAKELVDAGISLVGIDDISIAFGQQEAEVHRCLLQAGVVILEGLNLSDVEPGEYFLVALPLPIPGVEASPVRAVLLQQENEQEAFWQNSVRLSEK